MLEIFPFATKCNDTQEKAVIEAAEKESLARQILEDAEIREIYQLS
jgi:hypothetical protein